MEPNFSGYVSKANLQCADGRIIGSDAFKHQDGMKVPLVYQHNHDDLNQVLGHVILSHKDDGVWGDAFLNTTTTAQNAKALVEHGDLDKFSIWAKNLIESGMNVRKGDIQEVSLVLAGANPGANISNVLMHGGLDEDDTLMVVGFELSHAAVAEDAVKPGQPDPAEGGLPEGSPEEEAADAEKTVAEVLATLTDDQQTAVNAFIDEIVTEAVTEALTEEPAIQHDNLSSEKGNKMSRNVFDQSKTETKAPELKHSDITAILEAAKAGSGVDSLRDLVRSTKGAELMHAADYGVENIEVLFPNIENLRNAPTFVDRRQDWVKVFMAGVSKSPFSRIRTIFADITADEARAKGYIKANQKVEEVFPVFKRTTGPAMIYKKQKLDRQDIIDIADFDVVAWMKLEMRGKLDEELARAALLGDGRSIMDPDKVVEPQGNSGDGIRSILNDADMYTGTFSIPLSAAPTTAEYNSILDAVTEAREFYLGSGNLTAFVTYKLAAKLLTIRDNFGHRVYRTLAEVAADMDVRQIVRVPTELFPSDLLVIAVDLSDYNFGANRGGEVSLFDFFDIDFNQYKYLIETYLSGALTLPYAAQVFRSVPATNTLATPAKATVAANVVTPPTTTGVVYKRTDTGATVTTGSPITLDAVTLTEITIEGYPAAGYYFKDNLDVHDSGTFKYKA